MKIVCFLCNCAYSTSKLLFIVCFLIYQDYPTGSLSDQILLLSYGYKFQLFYYWRDPVAPEYIANRCQTPIDAWQTNDATNVQ